MLRLNSAPAPNASVNLLNIYREVDEVLNHSFTDVDSMSIMLQIMANAKDRKEQLLQQLITRITSAAPKSSAKNQPLETLSTANDPASMTTAKSTHEDELWLEAFAEQVLAGLPDFNFTLDRLSHSIFLSSRQIRRRLRRLTGMTFSNYLRTARLQKAHELLQSKKAKSVKQLAYQVGMKDVKYFSQLFKAHFGKSPSSFID